MSLKAVLQAQIPNWQGKLAVHHMGFIGDGHVHRGVPYNALNPKVVAKKLQLMQSAGVDTVITTWQGPWAGACHADALATGIKCEELGMTFMLLLDPGGMTKWQSGLTQAQITSNAIAALNDPTTQVMLNMKSYVPEKYVLDFSTGADLTAVRNAFPGLVFLQQSVGFSWPMIPWNQSSYASMNANAGMKVPGICGYFNDAGQLNPDGTRNYANSVWGGPARVLDHQGGQLLANQLPTIQSASPYIAVVSWDDYDEQSSGPLEAVVAAMSGTNWLTL